MGFYLNKILSFDSSLFSNKFSKDASHEHELELPDLDWNRSCSRLYVNGTTWVHLLQCRCIDGRSSFINILRKISNQRMNRWCHEGVCNLIFVLSLWMARQQLNSSVFSLTLVL